MLTTHSVEPNIPRVVIAPTVSVRWVTEVSYIVVLNLGNLVCIYSPYIPIRTLHLHQKYLIFISIS